MMRLNIGFFCQSIPFTDATIRLETSLGGSESALVGMARALAKLGHQVTVFTQIPDPEHVGVYDGVHWLDVSQLPARGAFTDWDVFISLRMPHVMHQPIQAKCRVVWNEDELSDPAAFVGSLWQVDELYYVSQWQRQHYESMMPPEAANMAYVTRNGVDLDMIDAAIEGVARNPNKLIYISRPERGLKPLLQIFPKMRERNPELELHICRYYSMYEPLPNIQAICDEADRAVESAQGVHYLGNLNKADLYREIASSALMVYPGVPNFNETSCIAAIEAQACGTPMVCSARGGLNETLHDNAGAKIEGDAYTEEYQQAFIDACFGLLNNPDAYRVAQMTGRGHAANYQFDDIAAEWSMHLDSYFRARFEDHSRRIYTNLIHHDDQRAALVCAQMAGFEEDAQRDIERLQIKETPEHYAEMALSTTQEVGDPRFETVLDMLEGMDVDRILDFACGNGSLTAMLAKAGPGCQVVGMDYSEGLVEQAREYATEQGLDNLTFQVGSLAAIEGTYDLIVCGEFLEHCWNPTEVIEALERCLTPGGWMLWTMPNGPFYEMLTYDMPEVRSHKVHWDYNAVIDVFGDKPGFTLDYYWLGKTRRGNDCGHWILKHQAGPTGEIDWAKKALVMRPYERLSVCMMTKDEELNLAKCLHSVADQADEIIVADMESTDATPDIAKRYGAIVKHLPARWPLAPEWAPNPGSFEWARNESVADATGDWVLWIDADEELLNPQNLRRYMHTQLFEGFIIRQNHLAIDQLPKHDTPARLYRNGRGYQFYGCIHEQNMKSLNEQITPLYEPDDVDIVHYGYVNEGRRQIKCKERNMQLLLLDRIVHPDRKLGQVLLAREYLNMIGWEVKENGWNLNDGVLPVQAVQAIQYAETILGIWKQYFANYDHPNHSIMFPVYQNALQYLGRGFQLQIGVGVPGNPQSASVIFETQDDVRKYIQKRTEDLLGVDTWHETT